MCGTLKVGEVLRVKLTSFAKSGGMDTWREHEIHGCVSAQSVSGRVHTHCGGVSRCWGRGSAGELDLGQKVKEGFCLLWNILILK